jgi:predicted permease
MVLTETVMLAVVASAAASSLSYWTAEIVRAMLAAEVSHVDAIGLDWRVLAFNLVTAATVGVLSGIASFMIVQSRDLAGALHHGGNRSATGRHRLRRALLAAEVAVTFVLVVSAGLLTRTLWNLYNLPRGFDGSRVVTAAVMPNMAGTIPEIQNVSSSFFDDLTERVGRLPGVEAAAAASNIPFSGRSVGSSGVWLVGEARPAEELFVTLAAVTPAYFTTIGATLTTGREFDRRDVAGRQRVAMVNETLRRTLAGDRNIVGALLQFGQLQLTVVGIVRDLPDTSLRAPAETFVYVPMSQTVGSNFAFGRLTILARTRHPNPSTLVPALRQTVWGLGDDVIIDEVATMNERLAASVRAERDSALLFGVLAALALLVAVAGIYGVVAYSVAQRTREIGIRIALGAARARVIGDIVLEAARPVVAGIVIGAAGALLATRALTTVLFQTEPMDSPTLAATALILGGTALVAAWIPARRAAQVDPVTALRAE